MNLRMTTWPRELCSLAICCFTAFYLAGDVAHSQEPRKEKPAVEKPERDHPETFEELVEIPKYKNARLLIPAEAPLPDLHRWEEHKRAMHLKALKRSGQDHPDLRRTVQLLTRAIVFPRPDQPSDASGERDPETKDEESSFQKINDDLTIFRFTNFNSFIKPGAEKKAVALGKAFFWDPRFSSDQKVACASCHYAAGTDHRTRGTVSLPVNFGIHMPWPDPNLSRVAKEFHPYNLSGRDLVAGSREHGVGDSLGIFDPDSLGGFKTREVIGSIGVPNRKLNSLTENGEIPDTLNGVPDVNGMEPSIAALVMQVSRIEATYRQVTQRNASTVINAVFNSRNFHDSRADSIFNGRTGWGMHDDPEVNDNLFVFRNEAGVLEPTYTWTPGPNEDRNPYFIANASLASQAVEPIVANVEMSYRGRMFHHIAGRMLGKKLLEGQVISPEDSSLGDYAVNRPTYEELIKEVFVDKWWNHPDRILLPGAPLPDQSQDFPKVADKPYSQAEANFSLFWGLALHVYQSTLISDDSPFDQEQRAAATSRLVRQRETGGTLSMLSDAARRGLTIFRNAGCSECHAGAELTAASFTEIGLLGRDGKPRFPDIFEEENDIVEGVELCPKEGPVGVECMNFSGRFNRLYDGGNYVVGISRYERRSNFPDSPPVRGGQLIERFLFPPDTAHWEDGGNGQEFIPPEEQPQDDIPFRSISELQRARFAMHLLANERRVVDLQQLLGVKINNIIPATKGKIEVSPSGVATPLPPAPGPLGSGNPINNTQRQRTRNQNLNRRRPGTPIHPSDPATQEVPEKAIPKKGVPGKDASEKVAPGNTTPNFEPSSDQFDETNPWALIPVQVGDVEYRLVTHLTPVPLRSISREFLPRWERDLRDRQATQLSNASEKISDAGAFKVPSLRNVELTGPYMHNGSLLTLDAVVEFYNRGGDFNDRVIANQDDTRTGHRHPEMVPLRLSPEQKSDLVEFLKSLTDERVRTNSGPFDRPSLELITEIDFDEQGRPLPWLENTVKYKTKVLQQVGRQGGAKTPSFEQVLENNHSF